MESLYHCTWWGDTYAIVVRTSPCLICGLVDLRIYLNTCPLPIATSNLVRISSSSADCSSTKVQRYQVLPSANVAVLQHVTSNIWLVQPPMEYNYLRRHSLEDATSKSNYCFLPLGDKLPPKCLFVPTSLLFLTYHLPLSTVINFRMRRLTMLSFSISQVNIILVPFPLSCHSLRSII